MNKSKEVYTAVDAKGSFTIYEGEVPLGDGILYGDTLFEGEYYIKGIKKMSEEKMKKAVVNCLYHWAYVNREEYDLRHPTTWKLTRGAWNLGTNTPVRSKSPLLK